MPIIVDCCHINSMTRYKNKLFSSIKKRKMDNCADNANHLIRDERILLLHKFIFSAIDKITPFLNKHSKINEIVMNAAENIIMHTKK